MRFGIHVPESSASASSGRGFFYAYEQHNIVIPNPMSKGDDLDILTYAEHYLFQGFSVVPVPHESKRPTIDWKQYQTERVSVGVARDWFEHRGDLGIGIICGKVSGNLVCLDFDDADAFEHFSKDPAHQRLIQNASIAKSSRGYHVFFRTPDPVPSRTFYLEGFEGKAGDLLSEGKLVVIPPTRHPSGMLRQWVRPLKANLPTVDLADLSLRSPDPHKESDHDFVNGNRHNSLVRLAADYAKGGYELSELRRVLMAANDLVCKPPLPRSEVEGIAKHFAGHDHHHPPIEINRDVINSLLNNVIPNPMPNEDDKVNAIFQPATDYISHQTETDMAWLVEGMLPLGYLVVLGATSKAGKSCLVTNLAHAVCTGGQFLGMPTTQGAVLWLAYEESEAERRMILRNYAPVSENLFLTHEKVILDSKSGIETLRYWIRKTEAKMLVVDPLYGAVQAESLSDGRKARTALEGLKDLCRTENVSAIVLHHFTKNVSAGSTRERFADSNQILATASMDWIMETRTQMDKTREIRLIGTGRGEFANKVWLISSPSEFEYELIASGTAEECERDHIEETLLKAVRQFPHGATADEIAEAMGANVNTTKNKLTALVKENKVTVIGKRGRASVYGADLVLVDHPS